MENTWLNYLAKRIIEDTDVSDNGILDRNDPAVKTILQNPNLLTAFTKNPLNGSKNQQKARDIVARANSTNKDLSVVAKAKDIASKGGLT